jgi:hypothetical protein
MEKLPSSDCLGKGYGPFPYWQIKKIKSIIVPGIGFFTLGPPRIFLC